MSVLFPEEPTDAPEQLLPEDDEPLSEDEEVAALDESIEDVPDEDDLVITVPALDPVGRSWAFDFQRRRFLIGPGGHGPVATYGDATLKVWIEKCLNTDRGAHAIYSDDYGVDDLNDGFGGPTSQFPTGDYEQRIRDALTFHPRIVDVSGFVWDLDPADDAISVGFQVDLDDTDSITVEGFTLAV